MINHNLYYYSKIVFSFTIFAFANTFFTLSSTQFLYNSDGSTQVLNARWIFAFFGCVSAYSTLYKKDRKQEFSIIAFSNAILFLILPFCRNQILFNFIVFYYGIFIYILQFLPILFIFEFKKGTKYLSSCLQIMFIFQSLDELLGRQIIKWIYEYDENTGRSTQKPEDGIFGTASFSSLWIPFLIISCADMIIAGLFWPIKDEFQQVPTEPPEYNEHNEEHSTDKSKDVVQISIENQDISSDNQIEMNIEDDLNVATEKNQFEHDQIEKNYQNDQIENLNESGQTAKIDEIDQINVENHCDEITRKKNQIYSNSYSNFFIIMMGIIIGIILSIQDNVKTYFLLSDQLNESELDENESKSTIQLIFASTILISRIFNMIITFRKKDLTFRLMILISLIFIFIGNLVIAFKLTIVGIIILAYGFSSILQMVILFIDERVQLDSRRICLLYLMISIFQLMKIYISAPFSSSANSMFFFMNCLFTGISFLFYFQLILIDFCKNCLEAFNFIGSYMG